MYYTSVQHDYISITSAITRESNMLLWNGLLEMYLLRITSSTKTKRKTVFFFFFLRKLFIESINLIIRFLVCIRLYMLENKYRSVNGLAKNTLGRGKRSIFLYLIFKCSFEKSSGDAWAIVHMYIQYLGKIWKERLRYISETVFSPISLADILTSRFGRNILK